MEETKAFTLQQARQLLPFLRQSLKQAQRELDETVENIQAAHDCYERAEKQLDKQSRDTDLTALRTARSDFAEAIESLSESQNAYVACLNHWVDKITSCGVILRDIGEGLLDFPAQSGSFKFLLCWKLEEADIEFWHDESSGMKGRKPLTTLPELD